VVMRVHLPPTLGEPWSEDGEGRSVHPLYLAAGDDPWGHPWYMMPVSMPEIPLPPIRVIAVPILYWPEATAAEMTAECRRIGISAALSWLVNRCDLYKIAV
jgi:hypothetical protein